MRIVRLAERATGSAIRHLIVTLASMRPDHRLSLRSVAALRRLALGPNALFPRSTPLDGSSVGDPALSQMLRGTELGVWALGPRSLDRILELVGRLRPKVILEFGSGISTVALALAISRGEQPDRRVISLEQDEAHGETTQRMLRDHGLDGFATVVVTPLVSEMVEGRLSTTYAVSQELRSAVGADRPDLIVVDGPAAEAGGRFATIPVAHQFTDSAYFVLDDALRDSELAAAAEWALLPYVEIHGVEPVEKGLLFGVLRPT
jgi:hypothetical protein